MYFVLPEKLGKMYTRYISRPKVVVVRTTSEKLGNVHMLHLVLHPDFSPRRIPIYTYNRDLFIQSGLQKRVNKATFM